jgi:hypothetical protein
MVKLDDGAAANPARWAAVLDDLLLGITHNISNRVATLAGVSDILAGDPTIPPILRALADEVPRLEEGIRLLRLLAAPEDEGEEALEATRVADDAMSLARLHQSARNTVFEVAATRNVPPVVARPTALTHELVVALVAAAEQAGDRAGGEEAIGETARVQLAFSTEGPDLVMTVGNNVVRARLLTAGRDGTPA